MMIYSTYPLFFSFFSHGAALLVLVFWAEDLPVPLVWSFYISERKVNKIYVKAQLFTIAFVKLKFLFELINYKMICIA